jgi:AP-3 complex subunit beta
LLAKAPSTALASTTASILSPSLAADLANLSLTNTSNFVVGQQNYVNKKEYELLNKINGNGLQILYRFPRTLNMSSNKMITIELLLSNNSNGDFGSLRISNKKLQPGMSMSEFDEFGLIKGATSTQKIGIDFNDTIQPAQFEISAIYSNDPTLGGTSTTRKWSSLSINCPIGELVQPGWSISENEFNKQQAKLKGMNEINMSIDQLSHAQFIAKNYNTKLLESISMCQIPSSQQDLLKYASLTASSKTPLLLSLFFSQSNNANKCQINVNCEKIILANMLAKEIKQLLG